MRLAAGAPARLILEGVGLLPFAKVYQLVAKLQEQARRQLNGDAAGADDRLPERASGA